MLKYILAIPLIMHGLANLAGVVAPWVATRAGFQENPWIFGTSVTFAGVAGKVSSIFWLLSSILFCGGGIGVLLGQDWWAGLIVSGAVASLVVILTWWKAVPPGARLGAFFDAILLVALLSPLKERIMEALGG
jgi:hypothetical protein